MILLLKMHATGEILGQICLKAIRYTIFSFMAHDQGKDRGHEGKGGNSIFWWRRHFIER